jgi:predicted lipase
MASTLVNAVSKLINKYPTTSILATGHSLGGALSTIAGIELKRIFNGINIELHNYGCPRIGNVHLAKHIHNKI